jgi:hypothetical protein
VATTVGADEKASPSGQFCVEINNRDASGFRVSILGCFMLLGHLLPPFPRRRGDAGQGE